MAPGLRIKSSESRLWIQWLSKSAILCICRQNNRDAHGRPQGGETGICLPLEIGTQKQKLIDNVKSAV